MTSARRAVVCLGAACAVAFVLPLSRLETADDSNPPTYVTHTMYGLPSSPWLVHNESKFEAVRPDGTRYRSVGESWQMNWLSVSWLLPIGVVAGLVALVRSSPRTQTAR